MSCMLAAPPSTCTASMSICVWVSATSGSMSGVMRVARAGIRFGGAWIERSSVCARAARSDNVCALNMLRTSVWSPSRRMRSITPIASSEWPPSSKKLSWRLTRSTCSSSRQIAASASSFAPRGASYSARAYASSAGAGSARRSSLPFGVSGHASSRTYADGTM
ncbi:hypothetical protein Y599_5869 [Burkholderia pseudomallei MSHR3458]|nr:hypothetical protein Y599_5869 [Burkholderia pseudomallei MSHR3458]